MKNHIKLVNILLFLGLVTKISCIDPKQAVYGTEKAAEVNFFEN